MTISLLMRLSMLFNVSLALAMEGEEIPFVGDVVLQDITMFGETIRFPEPARITGAGASVGKRIKVRGTLFFIAHARCSLCLEPLRSTFTIPLEAEYALSEDVSTEDRNPDVYLYDGASIDLTGMVADAVRLALPIQWRCAEDCKGLCPICGADRNKTKCGCKPDKKDRRPFAKLHSVKIRNDYDQNEV